MIAEHIVEAQDSLSDSAVNTLRAEGRQAVITTTLIIEFRVGTIGRFVDQAG